MNMESLVEIADIQIFDVFIFLQVGASDIIDQNVDPVVFFQCRPDQRPAAFEVFGREINRVYFGFFCF